jgi:hypothetical protein
MTVSPDRDLCGIDFAMASNVAAADIRAYLDLRLRRAIRMAEDLSCSLLRQQRLLEVAYDDSG